MKSVENFLFLLLHLLRLSNCSGVQVASGLQVGVEEVGTGQVSVLVARLIEQHYAGCHVVLLTTAPHSPTSSAIRR